MVKEVYIKVPIGIFAINLDALRYVVAVEFTEDGLVYKIIRRKARGKRIKITYVQGKC